MLTTQNKVQNYQFVSIPATAAQDRYYFPDLPNLREAFVHRIVAYNVSLFSNDINNQPLVTEAVFHSSYLTINVAGTETLQKVDLNMFNTVAAKNSHANFNSIVELSPVKIDFSKSYVTIAQGSILTPVYPFVYCFGIYYSK